MARSETSPSLRCKHLTKIIIPSARVLKRIILFYKSTFFDHSKIELIEFTYILMIMY